MVLSAQRFFLETIKGYCRDRAIAVEVRSGGWLIVMQRGAQRRLAFGYDVGLNGAAAHQIANDKAATAEVLQLAGVPCVPHALFLGEKLRRHIAGSGSHEAMRRLLDAHPQGLVVKPNQGTSGDLVTLVKSEAALERAVAEIFVAHPSLAISPYLDIDDEVRVVLLDERPLIVYRKQRPSAEWRHNLDLGAVPVLLDDGAARDTCIRLAIDAARAIGVRFGSIDMVRVDGGWRILEVNAGVKMEALARLHPELVRAAYGAALDELFRDPGESREP